MKYNVVVEKRAAKFIRKQQPAQQKRILEALAQLPFVGDIKPMAGMSGFYRLRVCSEILIGSTLSPLLIQKRFRTLVLFSSRSVSRLTAQVQIPSIENSSVNIVVQCSLADRKLISMCRTDMSQRLSFLNQRGKGCIPGTLVPFFLISSDM